MPNMQADQGQEENQELMAQLAASQARVRELEEHACRHDTAELMAAERIRQLQATLAEREGEVNQLNNVLRQAGWGQGEIDSAAYTFDKMAEANRTLVKERDLARQDAARLREAAQNLTCAVCKLDMQKALKGA